MARQKIKEYCIDDVIYKYNSGLDQFYVEGYAREFFDTTLTIRDEIDGKMVYSISAEGFKRCASLETVEIPVSIRSLGKSAFESCKNLKKVSFVESKTFPTDASHKIRFFDHAFAECHNLEVISIPCPIEVSSEAFGSCYALERIDAPVVGRVWPYAFKDCTRLQTVVLDDKSCFIYPNAFCGCTQRLNLVFKHVPDFDIRLLPEIKHMNIFVHPNSKLWELSYEGYNLFPLKDAPK